MIALRLVKLNSGVRLVLVVCSGSGLGALCRDPPFCDWVVILRGTRNKCIDLRGRCGESG
jgi:hypothetical protein